MTTAVILVGGLGTRLRSVVPNLPKPMAPINGRPFLEYQLDYWIAQGVSRFVLSAAYRNEIITNHFGGNYKGVEIDYVIEKEPLGTGGALLLATEKVNNDESFLLLNGDTYFAADLKALVSFSLENDTDWCFSLFQSNERERYMGMDVSPQGRITSLNSGTGYLVNGGVYWVSPRALHNDSFVVGDKISLEDEIFPTALASRQRLFGVEFAATFIDIGIPDDYYHAQTILK